MLTTGPIWAKPIWGTWWTWDARLTLTLFLFFLFVGYLALRAALHDSVGAGPLQRGGRHPRPAAGAVHSSERLSLPHAAPAADRAQAERAVAAAGDAADPADLGRWCSLVLYIGLVTVRYGLALAEEEREAQARCRLTTGGTWWRPTW